MLVQVIAIGELTPRRTQYTSEAPISTSPTSTSTWRPNFPPLPVDWSSAPTNASDGTDSVQTPSKDGSEASGGNATDSKPSSGTGNTGKQPQLASPVDYKAEFVGGVGGGANDPDYDYQTGKDQSSEGNDTTEQGPEVGDVIRPPTRTRLANCSLNIGPLEARPTPSRTSCDEPADA